MGAGQCDEPFDGRLVTVILWALLWQQCQGTCVSCEQGERPWEHLRKLDRADWVGTSQKWGWSFLRAAPTTHTTWLYPAAAKRPEDVCGPTQFRCVSTNTCISASFHCDEESDCPDRSDEFGCSEQGAGGELGALGWVPGAFSTISASTLSHLAPLSHSPTTSPFAPYNSHSCSHLPVPPQVVTPPQESIQASRGQTVTFTCVAIGVPTPIINWRLNWGHIPSHPRCGSEPRQGLGL